MRIDSLPLIVAAVLSFNLTLQLNAQSFKAVSDPSAHHLIPDKSAADASPYRSARNYGKRIAVFGGSLSVNPESDAAKQMWADMLGATVDTYGAGGAGFSNLQGYSLQKQVDTAGVYDVYVLWASTNDFTNNRECGTWKDYTAADGFDESKLCTQCGIPVLDQFDNQGINEFNYPKYYMPDKLHLTEEGYRRLAPMQVDFLANGR